MPLLQIHDVERSSVERQRAARLVTEAVVRAYDIDAATVDIVFNAHTDTTYAWSGALPAPVEAQRTFVTVHAFPRPLDHRREAARLITAALAGSFDVKSETIVIYFLDLARDQAAHGGVLAVDETAP